MRTCLAKVSGCGLVEGNFIFSEVMHIRPKWALSLAKHTKLLMSDGAQQQIIQRVSGAHDVRR